MVMKGKMNFNTIAKIIESSRRNEAIFGIKELGQLTPHLHVFAKSGNSAMVDLLLRSGASINGTEEQGMRRKEYDDKPFISALEGGSPDIAKMLIERGARPSQENVVRACSKAIKYGNTGVVEYLFRDFLPVLTTPDIYKIGGSNRNRDNPLQTILDDAVSADNPKIWEVISTRMPLSEMMIPYTDSKLERREGTAIDFIRESAARSQASATAEFFHMDISRNYTIEDVERFIEYNINKKPESAALDIIKRMPPDFPERSMQKFIFEAAKCGYKDVVAAIIEKCQT